MIRRLAIIIHFIFAAVMLFAASVFAQDVPGEGSADITSDHPIPVVGCEVPEPESIHLEFKAVEQVGPIMKAHDNVLLTIGRKRFRASDLEYNTESQPAWLQQYGSLKSYFVAKAKNATFTTCSATVPDYRLEARELTLLGNNKLRARGVSLFLGNFKVMTLPSIKMRVGGRSSSGTVFPRPGFDKEDGFTLSQDYRFVDEDNLHANADVRLTSNHGIQGQVYSSIGFQGDLSDLPGRYVDYESIRTGALRLPVQVQPGCTPESLRNYEAARLRAYGRFTLRQRTYNVNNTKLAVYRQPELGLVYTADQIYLSKTRLDPRLEIYPEVVTSWGMFKETPGMQRYYDRASATALGAVSLFSLGPNTAIQPIGAYSWSAYGTGNTYRVSSYGLDIAHLWSSGSTVSGRYLQNKADGITPFQFDSLEVQKEFQLAFQVQMGKNMAGAVVGYDFDTDSVYDWELLYGWRSDCLATRMRYDHRMSRLALDITIITQ